ncbi:site-specific tyrosine recombinase XerC [Roseateles sp. LKC17W]|uniref:Site-specific tyrosine recombinase XerC n=1 Tax=Pelomonas margarita TaxID=3299031 RepID=A0ABW7FPP5_9BURK
MPRAGQRIKTRRPTAVKPSAPAPKATDALAHNRLTRYMEEHFEWMLVTGYSADTVRARRQAIRKFIGWADERGLADPREITKPMLERYQRWLFYYRKPDTPAGRKDAGAPLTISMQYQYLAPLKTWFRWLSREHHILANPAADLDLPRQPRRLPRSVPSVQEVEAILAEADPGTAQGLRDRALLETLYAAGLRRMELAGAAVYDVDLTRGVLWVRHGKGNRQRVVPLGERAMAWLDKYLTEARPELLAGDTTALFLNDYGEPAHADFISAKVKRYMAFAGVEKVGSAHLLRHACATHMLEGGADIRFIQEMLGHANIETTEIYTHVSIDKLIAVHRATHPSRLQRHRGDPAEPVKGPSLDEAREALLSAIAADADDTA